MITLELPDGTKRPTPITDIDSIRVARGGTDLPELARLGVIVTYTDGTFDAVVGTFTELCAAIAAATPKARAPAEVLTDPQPGDRIEWSDGTLWLVVEAVNADKEVTFDETAADGKHYERVMMPIRIWSPPFPASEGVCVPASDVPPPTP